MIVHKFYYELELNDGTKFYFTDIDDNGNYKLETQHDSAVYYANVITGTGFFIDNDGRIATNRHIVDPAIREKEEVVKSILSKANEFKNQCDEAINEIDRKISTGYYNNSELYDLKGVYIKLSNFYNTIYSDINSGNVNLKDKIKCISIHLSIGYDNTVVENFQDLKECVINKVAADQETDLAIIQLKDKKTPQGVELLSIAKLNSSDAENNSQSVSGWDSFKQLMFGKRKKTDGYKLFSEKNESDDTKSKNHKVQITQPVYMIGYNAGFDLARAQTGLSAQLTLGNINQTPDENSIMYSIPCLPGSSGSPVVNENGEVIAINYSKYTGAQGFANGIPVKKLIKLMM